MAINPDDLAGISAADLLAAIELVKGSKPDCTGTQEPLPLPGIPAGMLTTTEVAEAIGISPQGVVKRIERGSVPGAIRVGKQHYIPKDYLLNAPPPNKWAQANAGRRHPKDAGPVPNKVVLNVLEVAEVLGCSRGLVYDLMDRAEDPLPNMRLGHKRMVPRDALMKWLERQV